jgi:hypothetical protein
MRRKKSCTGLWRKFLLNPDLFAMTPRCHCEHIVFIVITSEAWQSPGLRDAAHIAVVRSSVIKLSN